MKALFAFSTLLVLPLFVFAQVERPEWGEVSEADRTMTTYAADSEAEAVVLDEWMDVNMFLTASNGYTVRKIHRRVKILKESAVERGDISISYYNHKNYKGINKLRAQTIQPDGTVLEVDMKNNSFDSKEGEYYAKRSFGFPDVKVGSILEYSYLVKTPSLNPRFDWSFQDDIPTRRSVVYVEALERTDYVGILACARLETLPKQDKSLVYQLRHDPTLVGKSNFITIDDHGVFIVAEALPALRDVAYVSTVDNYDASVRFQLRGYTDQTGKFTNLVDPWPVVIEEYRKDYNIGSFLKRGNRSFYRELGPKLDAGLSKREQIDALYQFVNTQFNWNKEYHVIPELSLKKFVDTREGNSADMAYFLTGLLTAYGFDACAVLVRMRDEGRVITEFPRTSQFQSLVVMATVDEKPLLMEALGMAIPAGLLRSNVLNYEGLTVEDQTRWVGLAPGKSNETTYLKAQFEDGEMVIDASCSFDKYAAFQRRNYLLAGKTHTEEEYIEKYYQEDLPDAEIEDFEMTNAKTINAKLKEKCRIYTSKGIEESGDRIYVTPVLMGALEKNPLDQKERHLPIEFPYPAKDRYIFSLSIPEGYVVETLPESVSVRAADYGFTFTYRAAQKNNNITVNMETHTTGLLLPAEAYEALQQVFDMMVEKHGEMIVLRRAPEGQAVPTGGE